MPKRLTRTLKRGEQLMAVVECKALLERVIRGYEAMTNRSSTGLSPVCVMIAFAAGMAGAQSLHIAPSITAPNTMQIRGAPQGYLGVDLADVDAEHQRQLHLKDAHGALITLIDHDAPAGKIGLHVNDLVLQVDGQNVEDRDQARRLLHEVAPGQKVRLTVIRDGKTMHLEAQMADRRIIARNLQQQIATQHLSLLGDTGLGVVDPASGVVPVSSGGGFHWWTGGPDVNVGATVELLTPQMANFLGLENGLYVRSVSNKSEAAAAGLKATDVILKVGDESMATIADWERALNANDGKPVPLIVEREKRQMTLTLQVDSKRR